MSIELNPNIKTSPAEAEFKASPNKQTGLDDDVVPPVTSNKYGTVSLDLPTLTSSAIVGGMSLENLMETLSFLERKMAAQNGIESIEARGKERKEVNDKEIKNVMEQLEKAKSKSILDGFLKAFKIIGMLFGAIASAITVGLGVITGNPILIAAGVIMGVMVVNSIISEATDGVASIGAGISKLFEAMGVPESVAKWIGFAYEMAITLTSVILSFGASAPGAIAQAAAQATSQAVAKTVNILGTIARVTALANGVVEVTKGATQIGGAVLDYNVANMKARMKELTAILERIKMADELDMDHLEDIMKKIESLMQSVKDIVDGAIETQTIILGGSPTMA